MLAPNDDFPARPPYFLAIALLGCLLASPVRGEIVRDQLWVANNNVYTVTQWNNTIFLGGGFTLVGPPTGGVATIDATTGSALTPYSGIAGGGVFTVAPDGSGGYYVGGDFTGIHGKAQAHLAHFDASGNLSAWNPNVDSRVTSIAVSGSTIYIGGSFTHVGGQQRSYLAAVDAGTGNPTSWNPNSGAGTGGNVGLFLLSGNTLYVGGLFHNIGGVTRNLIASFDLTTGSLTSWNPDGQASGTSVDAIAKLGTTIYVGGMFSQIGGQPRNRLAALDATSGLATTWNPNVTGNRVQAIIPTQQTISPFAVTFWLAGDFTAVGGTARSNIASVDGTGTLISTFNPGANSRVDALLVPTDGSGNATAIYAGGNFTVLAGSPRNYIASMSPTGVLTSWDPKMDSEVYTLLTGSGAIVAGGIFNSAGMTPRSNLAALDGTSGALTSWNPSPDGGVRSLSLHGNTLYVGGSFSSIALASRAGAAAFDLTSFSITPWDPKLTCVSPTCTAPDVYAIAQPTVGNNVYVGGLFSSTNGLSRRYLAAVDTSTGATLSSFNANVNNFVQCLAVRQRDVAPFDPLTVYIGGVFSSVGFSAINGIAEVNASTGSKTTWSPMTDPGTSVYAVAFQSGYPSTVGTVFVGGVFSNMAGQMINDLVAIDATSANSKSWNIGLDVGNQVNALMVRAGFVYVGGVFPLMGGVTRNGLACINATTGVVTSWDPEAKGVVDALGQYGGTILAGGNFHSVSNYSHTQFAGIGDGTVTGVASGRDVPRPGGMRAAPNPFTDETALHFTLPREECVTIGVYSVAGQLVRRVYQGALSAGEHVMRWDGKDEARQAAGSGIYFARVTTDSRAVSTRVILVR